MFTSPDLLRLKWHIPYANPCASYRRFIVSDKFFLSLTIIGKILIHQYFRDLPLSAVEQKTSGITDGILPMVIWKTIFCTDFVDHQAAGLHGMHQFIRESAGSIGIGTGFAAAAAACSKHQHIRKAFFHFIPDVYRNNFTV